MKLARTTVFHKNDDRTPAVAIERNDIANSNAAESFPFMSTSSSPFSSQSAPRQPSSTVAVPANIEASTFGNPSSRFRHRSSPHHIQAASSTASSFEPSIENKQSKALDTDQMTATPTSTYLHLISSILNDPSPALELLLNGPSSTSSAFPTPHSQVAEGGNMPGLYPTSLQRNTAISAVGFVLGLAAFFLLFDWVWKKYEDRSVPLPRHCRTRHRELQARSAEQELERSGLRPAALNGDFIMTSTTRHQESDQLERQRTGLERARRNEAIVPESLQTPTQAKARQGSDDGQKSQINSPKPQCGYHSGLNAVQEGDNAGIFDAEAGRTLDNVHCGGQQRRSENAVPSPPNHPGQNDDHVRWPFLSGAVSEQETRFSSDSPEGSDQPLWKNW